MQAHWKRFLLEAPEYPGGFFRERGIAILAGGPFYMVPAWVNIKMLRRAGEICIYICTYLYIYIYIHIYKRFS